MKEAFDINDYLAYERAEMIRHHEEAIAQIRYEHSHLAEFHYQVQPIERIKWHEQRIAELQAS